MVRMIDVSEKTRQLLYDLQQYIEQAEKQLSPSTINSAVDDLKIILSKYLKNSQQGRISTDEQKFKRAAADQIR